ncbi:hypothetical protein Rhe02_92670 [Rhizocola hellebori]|uniref:Uncharacterized protein n=1 Tax=Rhizocola hellebori TaxID=1392758 RepID=A0A8J3VLU3_9ACTN|nr:hypothetical protein [Rhizocola hellebori]GIH11200.1 hypothetical protein Rhe02_92670 [Rhizocola hellebori]
MVSTAVARPAAGYRTNLVTALLGAWLTVGLLLDTWAHNNKPELESFFTPWHGVFYTGFFATAAWIGWTVRGPLLEKRYAQIPAGYGAAVVAVGVFALCAFGDMMWHLTFGIEQTIDILFSPTHLGLGASMVTILLTPVRSAWADRSLPAAPSLGRLLPSVASTALAATVTLLFLQYANAFTHGSGDVVVALSTMDQGFTADLVTDMVVTNLVLLLPILTLARRWTLPFGVATVLYAAAATLSAAVTDFDNWELMLGMVAAGVAVDLLARWLDPSPQRLVRFRVFAAAAPLVTWAIYIATAYLTSPPLYNPDGRVEAMPEVYTGAPIVQALLGLLVGILLIPDFGGRTTKISE